MTDPILDELDEEWRSCPKHPAVKFHKADHCSLCYEIRAAVEAERGRTTEIIRLFFLGSSHVAAGEDLIKQIRARGESDD